MRTSLAKSVAAIAAVLAVSACGATNPEATGSDDPEIMVSRVKTYDSLAELAKDSAAIVRVRVGDDSRTQPADEAGQLDIPATIVSATVVESLKGDLSGTIPIRLITSENDNSEVPPPLTEGEEYVLFLEPFEFQHGKPTGEWTSPGGVGIYKVVSNEALKSAFRGEDALPASFKSVADLTSQLR